MAFWFRLDQVGKFALLATRQEKSVSLFPRNNKPTQFLRNTMSNYTISANQFHSEDFSNAKIVEKQERRKLRRRGRSCTRKIVQSSLRVCARE